MAPAAPHFSSSAFPNVECPTYAWRLAGVGAALRRMSSSSWRSMPIMPGYLDRQEADIIAFRREESLRIPDELELCRGDGTFHRGGAEAGGDPAGHAGAGGEDRWRNTGGADLWSWPISAPKPPRANALPPEFGPEEFAASTGVSRETLRPAERSTWAALSTGTRAITSSRGIRSTMSGGGMFGTQRSSPR